MKVEATSNDDDSNTSVITITTPDIVNGKIKSIEVENSKYHSVSMKFSNESDKMEVDDGNNGGFRGADKRIKIFEQFDFQKIIYVKKKTSSQVK